MMKWMSSAAWVLFAAVLLGSLAGCNKPSEGGKKPAAAPSPVPINTTDSK